MFSSISDSDGDVEKEKKKTSPPINTIPYTVQASDTLNSVAARFDITPSELRKLNRLASNLIFPGQLIHVPEKKVSGEGDDNPEETLTSASTEDGDHEPPSEEKDILDNLRPVSPKPGHIERVKAPMSPQSKRHDPREARFLKINVRHITDGQGVVGGVLLVTPNAVMFDPNVSDPLVIEHGPESYGVIAPMEFVVNAAIYYDIAHMRVGHTDNKSDCNKPEIYYAKSNEKDKLFLEPQGSPGRDSLLVKDETFPELAPSKGSSDEDNESLSSYTGRDGDAFPKAFERDLVTPTNLTDAAPENQTTTQGSSLVSQQSCPETQNSTKRTLEERRTSSLDHHWAVPKPKSSSDSVDAQTEIDRIQLGETARGVEDASSEKPKEGDLEDRSRLTKLSCYDSGIDIRDTTSSTTQDVPIVVTPLRRVTRDADIIFSSKDECVVLVSDGKKKTSSVSFSVENNNENKETVKEEKAEDEKASEGKKSKMLKRLSYPISWMEGSFVNESKDSEKDSLSSLPTSADSQHSSVFSKVFSSSPKSIVSDIGSGIVDLGSGIADLGSGIGSGIVDLGTGIGSGIVDLGSGIGSGIVDLSSGIGSGLSDFGSNLFMMKNPSEDSGGTKSPASTNTPVTRSPLTSRFPPQPPNTPCPNPEAHSTTGKKEGILGRSSVGAFIRSSTSNEEGKGSLSRSATPKLDYRSMVSVEDMPELFVSFDKLILRPARSCEDPPLYLRLRMGKPIDKKIPKSTPIMSYGKKKMRPEYWFSVPRNRVDELYNFLHIWVPHLYGDLDEMDPKARGYELVESDTEIWDEEEVPQGDGTGDLGENDDLADLTRESWEMVKAPYVKLYAILKSQNLSSDSQGANEEVCLILLRITSVYSHECLLTTLNLSLLSLVSRIIQAFGGATKLVSIRFRLLRLSSSLKHRLAVEKIMNFLVDRCVSVFNQK
ncbi:hypothetical protein RUM43_000969 [Polyplax serrata]|uniref:LysM domain-containing protein n=1 Tax=Polyplax serrata TaxID=468196 RepID=A0AAN8SH40_POLSC